MADTSLQSAIESAAAELKAESDKTTSTTEKPEETPVAEETTEETTEETPETPETSDDLTPEQLIESKNLYKALSGPQANAIIAALADRKSTRLNSSHA